MSSATPKDVVALLDKVLNKPENACCAECKAPQPSWCSTNLGIFLCMDCAGVHRSLGVHISKVRSVRLDTWTRKDAVFMANMGNAKGNSWWEATLPQHRRITAHATSSERSQFIRDKYERRLWYAKPQRDQVLSPKIPAEVNAMFAGLRVRSAPRAVTATPASTPACKGRSVEGFVPRKTSGHRHSPWVAAPGRVTPTMGPVADEAPAPAASPPVVDLFDGLLVSKPAVVKEEEEVEKRKEKKKKKLEEGEGILGRQASVESPFPYEFDFVEETGALDRISSSNTDYKDNAYSNSPSSNSLQFGFLNEMPPRAVTGDMGHSPLKSVVLKLSCAVNNCELPPLSHGYCVEHARAIFGRGPHVPPKASPRLDAEAPFLSPGRSPRKRQWGTRNSHTDRDGSSGQSGAGTTPVSTPSHNFNFDVRRRISGASPPTLGSPTQFIGDPFAGLGKGGSAFASQPVPIAGANPRSFRDHFSFVSEELNRNVSGGVVPHDVMTPFNTPALKTNHLGWNPRLRVTRSESMASDTSVTRKSALAEIRGALVSQRLQTAANVSPTRPSHHQPLQSPLALPPSWFEEERK